MGYTYRKKPSSYVRTFAPTVIAQPPTYKPSVYQQAILDWLASSTGSLIVDAKAGSGKTSTGVLIAFAIPTSSRARFVAFNKSIATELSTRLPSHVPASTWHSLAFSALGRTLTSRNNGTRPIVDANKVGNLFDQTYPQHKQERAAVLKLVAMMKAGALLPDTYNDDLLAIIDHFAIEWDGQSSDITICDMARAILALNNADTRVVDFDDMLYLVIVYDVSLDKQDIIFVDEAQDTNTVQRLLLRRMMHSTTRIIAVGDPNQAIYGFRGADSDSLALIAQDFDCITLPLSVSYRCPRAVVELAQTIVPSILPRDNAPDGHVLTADKYSIRDFLPTDLLVCRNTAPLVKTAYKMLSRRIPCKIMGREIGRALVALIEKIAGKRGTLDTLPDQLENYRAKETAIAYSRKQEIKAQAINDRCDAIMALLDSLTTDDITRGIPGLTAIIDSMFSDTQNGCVTLATVHKAKGLEAPRVVILDPQLMPSKYARQPWQMEQEHNLMYVAYTRALDTLVFLDTNNLTD